MKCLYSDTEVAGLLVTLTDLVFLFIFIFSPIFYEYLSRMKSLLSPRDFSNSWVDMQGKDLLSMDQKVRRKEFGSSRSFCVIVM